jgi:hypothetical protein
MRVWRTIESVLCLTGSRGSVEMSGRCEKTLERGDHMHTKRIINGLTVSVGMLLLAVTVADAAVVVKQSLTPTSKVPNASGRATLTLKHASKGKFTVATHGLPPNATFDVVVGGVKVGTLITNGHGAGKTKFRTSHAKRKHQLLGFDPRGDDVIVRDGDGDDDLIGHMPGDGGSAEGAFACCLPDREDGDREDGEVECEEETPTDCTNAGGTPQQVTSCLPDPCVTTPVPGTVCCIPESARGAFLDDDGDEEREVECEEHTADCAAKGGTVVTATSCDPNPCTPTPPPSLIACCVRDEDETECKMLTPEACTSRNGVASGSSCASHPCGNHEGDQGEDGDMDGQGEDD